MSDSLNLSLFSPESTWTPPKTFPNMSSVKRVYVDLETKDPNLVEQGPGSFRRDGFPVGIALAFDNYANYFPIRHLSGGNLDDINVIRFFRDLLSRKDLEVVGANTIYDVEWLNFLGIEVSGTIRDIQIAEALMDEEQDSYSLNALCKKYLNETKNETLLREAAAAYGIDPKSELWKLHSKYVGPYAIGDVVKTKAIFEKQLPLLHAIGLNKIWELESALTPIIFQMRRNGVRINQEKAQEVSKQLKVKEDNLHLEIKKLCGQFLDVNSPQMIAGVCDRMNISYGRTAKGNPTFDKVFLKNSDHPLFKLIQKTRSVVLLRNTYVNKLLLRLPINGRLHGEFHQMRNDEDGTKTGRFSSSSPNLQQIPARDEEIAPLIRGLFIPEEGEKWAKLDYSQQEPRILTHFGFLAKFRGADKVRDCYLQDKKSDFYQLVANEAKLKRKPAKDLTLGRCYGEGKDKMARDLGVSLDEAARVLETFDKANPFVKELADSVSKVAEKRGYIITLLGRHLHFNFWEPANWKENPHKESLRLEAARKRWPEKHLRRAFLYKALNKLIQGSAADMTKAAMLKNYNETKRVPLLQVHDELDFSVPDRVTAEAIQFRMENCVDMTVPIWAELEFGDHWK
jgi:DNA polymerase I-like protein with 3'-5' exonuclease and polymerase domains